MYSLIPTYSKKKPLEFYLHCYHNINKVQASDLPKYKIGKFLPGVCTGTLPVLQIRVLIRMYRLFMFIAGSLL